MRTTWLVLLVAACGLSDSTSFARLPGEQSAVAQPAAPVAPDRPSGSAREAELAKTVGAIVDAFTDGGAVFTREGKQVVYSSTRDGLPQIYAADVAKPEAAPRRIVTSSERITTARPLPDGKTIIFWSDHGADENWSFYTVGLDGTGLTELTPGPKMQRDEAMVADGAPTTVFYSARASSDTGSSIWSLQLAPGAQEKRILKEELPGFLLDVSHDGKRGLYVRYTNNTDNTLLLIDLGKGTTTAIYPAVGAGQVQVWNAAFSADDKRIFVATDGGGEQGLLLALDTSGKELGRYTESSVPTASIDGLEVAKNGGKVALLLDVGNHSEVRLLDSKTLKPAVDVAMPLGSGAIGAFSEDGQRLTAQWSTPKAPMEIYAINAESGKASALRKEPRPSIDDLPETEASIVSVKAFDGLELPTNVYLPRGAAGKKLPVIVVYHGGPSGSSAIRWNTGTRFFTSLGYAVVEPNVRGSGGFGRAFEMADNGPKRFDAFKDIETTARWAAAQPWADKDRLVVMGGSYGGYTVVIALERWPDIWRAGVDLFGVVNMTTFLQSTSGLIREIFKLEFGDLDKDAAFLKTISPIEEVDKIVDPLFVYAGANDPRVPRPESDQIVRALRERNVPVEYMVADNEGHSLSRKENQVAYFSRAARFLEQQLQAK